MWKHVARVASIVAATAAVLLWFATTSVPTLLTQADSNFGATLKWAGWEDAPPALASDAADNWVRITAIILLAVSLLVLIPWALERRSQLKIVRLEKAEDTPSPGQVALWLFVKNRSRERIDHVLATLTKIDPYPPAFPEQALPPIPLATKSALENHRAGGQPLDQGGFTLLAGTECPVELAWLPETNALQWYVTRAAGNAEYLLDKTYTLTVQVGGGPRPCVARIELELTNFENGSWNAWLLRNNVIARVNQWRRARQRIAAGKVIVPYAT